MLLLFAVSVAAGAQAVRQTLSHQVRPEVASGQTALVGPVPADQVLHLSIALPLRDPAALTHLLTELYDPTSPQFRHFLSVAQFTEQFGPSVDDYAAVVRYAQANGLTVTGTPANRLIVPVSGTVAEINQAFGITLNQYQHPTEQRTFFSPDREPSLDLPVPVAHIFGLNNFSLPRPHVVHPQGGHPAPNLTGSGPGGSYLASDMRAAYYGGSTLTGNGQTVGLLEFSGYDINDVNLTFTNAGQGYTVPVNNVLLDGATGTGGSDGEAEVVLDIVQAIGMAPGLDQVRVYIGAGQDDANLLNSMAAENIAKVLSCSWSWMPDDPAVDDPFFQEFAAQGQSFLAASGDSGAFDSAVDPYLYPQEDAYITAVGGTHLSTNGAGGSWSAETVWNSGGGGSGGGISPDNIALPSWQAGLATVANGGSNSLRNVPDVAMEGDFDNYVCTGGACFGNYAGTSFAAPRWAGFLALVNEQAVEAGTAPAGGIGFVNPSLYRLAQGTNAAADFHDITVGNNDTANQPIWFNAVPGYDLATGWGSANGQSLINDLAGPQVPGFWLQPSSPSLSLDQGASASTTLTVSDAGGFNGNVALAISTPLPSGVTATWSANPAQSTSVLTLTATATAPPGTTTLTITGTSGALSATTDVTVAVHAPTFAISASPDPLALNQGATATTAVQVTPEYGFSGAVTLAVSGMPAGVTAVLGTNPTSGSSTLTFTASNTAATGTSPVTITGTAGSLSVTHTLSLSVHAPTFTISGQSSLDIGQGTSATASYVVNALYGFNGSVNLAVSGLPVGVTAAFSPNPTTGNTLLTLTAATSAAVGISHPVITGTSGSLSASTALTLTVHVPTFTLSNPGTLNIGQGSSGSSSLYVSPEYGFTGSVTFSVSGLPANVTALWNPNPSNGLTQLSLAAAATAPAGQYTLTITGVSGSQSATTTLTLGVFAPTFSLYSYGPVSVGQGTSASNQVVVTSQYGFTGSVHLAATGLPAGVTASFSPNPTTGTAAVTFTASNIAPVGQDTVTITGTSGTQTASTSFQLGVFVPTFSLNTYISPTLGQGTSTTGYVEINALYGFAGSVNLSVAGLPAGVTATLSPNPATNSSALTLTASPNASVGQYSLTVTGVSGAQTASTTVLLGVFVPTFSLFSSNSVAVGQGKTITNTVSVNPMYGFAGNVTLSVSGLPAGVSGTFSPNPVTGSSTLTLTATGTATLGQYTATLTGTSGTQTASIPLTVGVFAPSFTLFSGGSVNVGQGSSNSTFVFVSGSYGFNGDVTLGVSGLPSGVTASFSPNPTSSNSTLVFTANSTAALGQYTLTVTGTSASATAATTLTLGVFAPSFQLLSYSNGLTLNQGASGTAFLSIAPQYGFSSPVTFAASGLPNGVTATFSPNPATSASTVTLAAGNTATPGPATVTITGTAGSLTASTTLPLIVNASNFTLSAAPSTVSLVAGATEESTVLVLGQNGFAGSVSLAVSGLPVGVTGLFSNSSTTGTSTLLLTASNSAAPGTATATITGTSGALSASVSLPMTVRAALPATSTQLTLSAAGSPVTTTAAGTVVMLTASVTANGTSLTTGQVAFCDAAASICTSWHNLGTAQLTSAGTALLKLTPGAGSHSFKAVFLGTTTQGSSSSPTQTLAITAATPTSTALTAAGNPGNYSLTATVTGAGPVAPTGAVRFLDTSSGNLSLSTANLGQPQPALALAPPQTLPAGAAPTAIAIADLNGDGLPDLAIADFNASNVTIQLGTGNGSFTPAAQNVTTVTPPRALVTADFNADGKPDLAVLNAATNSLSVFLGNGDGTFTPSTLSPQTGSYPVALVTGDFNGDGLPDLAVLNQNSSTVTVLLGNGDGTFTPSALSSQTGSGAIGMAVADFNGDGKEDLAVAGPNGTVLLLLGNGDGSFSAGPPVAAGQGPSLLAVADLNADGIPDLVVGGSYNFNLTVLLGKGDGTFSPAASAPLLTFYPSALAISDLNGDGVADLAVTGGFVGQLAVLFGKGDGTFAAGPSHATGMSPAAVSAADLNGDGVPDLAVTNSYDNTLSTFTSVLTQTATAVAANVAPVGPGAHQTEAVYAGDTVFATSTSAAVPLSAAPLAPTLTLQLSAPAITTAQALTVTLTATGSPTPTGSVALSGGGFTSPAIGLINGVATVTVSAGALTTGTDTLTAIFTPDAAGALHYTTATGTASVTVTAAPRVTPVVSVTPSAASITVVQPLSITTTVTAASVTAAPTGSVVLTGGGFTSAPVALANGTATFTAPAGALAAGTDVLTVSYTPDAAASSAFNPASGSGSVVVTPKATPTVAVTPASGSISVAQTLTVSIAVATAHGSPTPTGSVILSGGGYASAAASLASGAATLTVPAGSLLAGTDQLTATYTPDAASASLFNGASGSAPVTVRPLQTPTLSVAPAATAFTTAQPVAATVTVAGGAGNPTPTGSVTLTSGSYTSAPQALADGTASFSLAAGTLPAGTDPLHATYTPDTAAALTYTPAGQTATVTVTPAIGSATAAVTVTALPTAITDQQTATVAVAVAGPGGQPLPTGTVTLTSGSYHAQQAVANGSASFTLPAGTLGGGANTLTASYSGDPLYAASSGTATLSVVPVLLSASTPPTIAAGATASATLTLAASSTYAGTMNLSCALTASPAGAQNVPTCSLAPGSVQLTGGGTATATLSVHTTAPSTASDSPLSRPGPAGLGLGTSALAGILCLFLPSKRRRWVAALPLLLVGLLVAGVAGCGGHPGSSGTPPNAPLSPGTTTGAYSFTVTGTDAAHPSVTVSTVVNVTVGS